MRARGQASRIIIGSFQQVDKNKWLAAVCWRVCMWFVRCKVAGRTRTGDTCTRVQKKRSLGNARSDTSKPCDARLYANRDCIRGSAGRVCALGRVAISRLLDEKCVTGNGRPPSNGNLNVFVAREIESEFGRQENVSCKRRRLLAIFTRKETRLSNTFWVCFVSVKCSWAYP